MGRLFRRWHAREADDQLSYVSRSNADENTDVDGNRYANRYAKRAKDTCPNQSLRRTNHAPSNYIGFALTQKRSRPASTKDEKIISQVARPRSPLLAVFPQPQQCRRINHLR